MHRKTIVQGEFAVVERPGVVITTVLGSCVSVCLMDPVAKVGGMNHFLLDEPVGASLPAELHKYGIHAMELLVNAMMRIGAERARLRAHLYGGANIVPGLGPIGSRNIDFARRFLAIEGIIVTHENVGGAFARRVEFLPNEARARCVRVLRSPEPDLNAGPRTPAAPGGVLELFR